MVTGAGITPYMRTRDSALRNHPLYGPERFTYLPESNSYRCPTGQQLNYVGLNAGIAPMPTSEAASVAVRAHKKRNAPAGNTSISPSTFMNLPDNTPET